MVKQSTYTYKSLLAERSFLKVQERARLVTGINLISIDYVDNTIRFQCNSVSTPGKTYSVLIQLSSLGPEEVISAGSSLATVLRDARIKVYCSCPAFIYWGFKWKAWSLGYGLFSETRFPKVRNPGVRGFVCKHLYACLLAYPFWVPDIGKKLRVHYTSDQQAQISDALRVALRDKHILDA